MANLEQTVFTERAAALMQAHEAGPEEFALVAGEALTWAAGFPDRLIGPGTERTEGLTEVTLEFAFRGLRGAVADEKIRRDLGQVMYGQLMTGETALERAAGPQSRDWAVMLEAFHNAFPDEAGEPTEAWGWDADWSKELPLQVSSTDPIELQGAIDRLLDRAASLEEVILDTNKDDNRIILLRDDATGRIAECNILVQEGQVKQEIIIRHGPADYYVKYRVYYTTDGRNYDWEKRIGGNTNTAEGGSQLVGTIVNDGTEHLIDENKLKDSINRTFAAVDEKLAARQTAATDGVL